MIVIGIDPGMTGAFAFLDENGELQDVVPMPVDRIEVTRARRTGKNKYKADRGKPRAAKSVKNRISVAGVLTLLRDFDGADCRAYMERLVAMPSVPGPGGVRRAMGVAGMGEFFRGGGIIEAALAAFSIPLTIVDARTWKTEMRCPTGKDAARARASQQFPLFASMFRRVNQDGLAEASMIALYGVRDLGGLQLRRKAAE